MGRPIRLYGCHKDVEAEETHDIVVFHVFFKLNNVYKDTYAICLRYIKVEINHVSTRGGILKAIPSRRGQNFDIISYKDYCPSCPGSFPYFIATANGFSLDIRQG